MACLALASTPSGGQPWEVRTTADGPPEELRLEVRDGRIELTLEQALEVALERNLSLTVQRYRRSQSLLGVTESRGIFDLNLSGSLSTSSESRPSISALEQTGGTGLVEDQQGWNFTLSRLTRFGGTASVDFFNFRSESNDTFDTVNPLFVSNFDFNFVQPLLRNFGSLPTERDILVARNLGHISREDFQLQLEQVVQQLSDRYWELVEAREQLAVSQESLALAKELHEMNRIQVDVGTLAPLEMVTSEAGVATREEEIIRRQAAVEDGADRLRQLLNLERGSLWNVEVVPISEPEPETKLTDLDFDEAFETALEERPEVRSKRLELENLGVDARLFRNQKLPRLDLETTYGFNGIGGTFNVVDRATGEVLETIPGGYGDAIEQIRNTGFDGWQIALTFAVPIENRQAKARSARAELAVEQGDAELRELEQQIHTEVRSAARAVETAVKQIESAKVSSRLEEKNLDAEQKRYENGLSTSFRVLEIQEQLAAARSREVSAVITYRKAVVAYHRAIGRLIEETGIVLADDEAGAASSAG